MSRIIKPALPFFVSILFLFFFPVPLVFSSPQLNNTYKYYDVSGDKASQLRQEMNKKRPSFKGRRYDAVTSWDLRWHYIYKRGQGTCAIDAVITSLDIVYQFPRWINRDIAGVDLTGKWDNYISALKLHEDGRAAIGKEAAEEIESALPKIGEKNSCESCGMQANTLAKSILEKYRKKEANYDKSAGKGKNEGARFP